MTTVVLVFVGAVVAVPGVVAWAELDAGWAVAMFGAEMIGSLFLPWEHFHIEGVQFYRSAIDVREIGWTFGAFAGLVFLGGIVVACVSPAARWPRLGLVTAAAGALVLAAVAAAKPRWYSPEPATPYLGLVIALTSSAFALLFSVISIRRNTNWVPPASSVASCPEVHNRLSQYPN